MRDHGDAILEEKLSTMFQPDTLATAHYFESVRSTASLEPEKRLMLAILEDAVRCFQDYVSEENEKKKKLFEEAEAWILNGDSAWIFSFDNACEALGLHPQSVRQGLLRWKEKKLAEPQRQNDSKRKRTFPIDRYNRSGNGASQHH